MPIELIATLIAILGSLVAALIFVVRTLVNRSDKQAAVRDIHMSKLIQFMQQALSSFSKFEKEEEVMHAKIIRTQNRIIDALDKIVARLDGK